MDDNKERKVELKERMEDFEMDDNNILKIENAETDLKRREKCLEDIRKIHPKFEMAITEEISDSKLDVCNGVSHQVLISNTLRKDGNGDVKVPGNFKKFVINKEIQRLFNKKPILKL